MHLRELADRPWKTTNVDKHLTTALNGSQSAIIYYLFKSA